MSNLDISSPGLATSRHSKGRVAISRAGPTYLPSVLRLGSAEMGWGGVFGFSVRSFGVDQYCIGIGFGCRILKLLHEPLLQAQAIRFGQGGA